MEDWLEILERDETQVNDFFRYYREEVNSAEVESEMVVNIDDLARHIPAIMCKRLTQLYEVEAVLAMFKIRLKSLRSKHYRGYREFFGHAVEERDLERLIDGHGDVIDLSKIVDRVALLRKKFLAVTKILDCKNREIGEMPRDLIARANLI